MLFNRVGATIARDNKSTPGNCSTAMVVFVGHAESSLMMLPQDGLPDDGANISLSTTIVQVAMM